MSQTKKDTAMHLFVTFTVVNTATDSADLITMPVSSITTFPDSTKPVTLTKCCGQNDLESSSIVQKALNDIGLTDIALSVMSPTTQQHILHVTSPKKSMVADQRNTIRELIGILERLPKGYRNTSRCLGDRVLEKIGY